MTPFYKIYEVQGAETGTGTPTAVLKGSGSLTDPWLIETPDDLVGLSNISNSPAGLFGFVDLINDIDMSLYGSNYRNGEGFPPIFSQYGMGNSIVFNGNNKVISNLYINDLSSDSPVGLFGYLHCDAQENLVTDLILKDVEIRANGDTQHAVGALVGELYGSTIGNVHITGTVASTKSGFNKLMGGVVGDAVDFSTVNNVSFTGTLSNEFYIVGGLVGSSTDSVISNSYADIVCHEGLFAAGLAGSLHDSTLLNCYAIVDIDVTGPRAAGVVSSSSYSTYKDIYVVGNVKGSSAYGFCPIDTYGKAQNVLILLDTVTSINANQAGIFKKGLDFPSMINPISFTYYYEGLTLSDGLTESKPDSSHPTLSKEDIQQASVLKATIANQQWQFFQDGYLPGLTHLVPMPNYLIPDKIVSHTALDIEPPVIYGIPQTIIDDDEYTGTILWYPIPVGGVFASDISYTAIVTVTPKEGYTFDGVTAPFTALGGTCTKVADDTFEVIYADLPTTISIPFNVTVYGYDFSYTEPAYYGNVVTIHPVSSMKDSLFVQWIANPSVAMDNAANYGAQFVMPNSDVVIIGDYGSLDYIYDVKINEVNQEVEVGDKFQFTASVLGSAGLSADVVWSVVGNMSVDTVISASGELTVGEDEAISYLSVKATSVEEPYVFGVVQVTIKQHPPTNTSTPTPTNTSIPTPTNTSTPTPTNTPSPSPTPSPTITITPTISPTNVPEILPTGVPTDPYTLIVERNVELSHGDGFQFTIDSIDPVSWSVLYNTSVDTVIASGGFLVIASDETSPQVLVIATSDIDSDIYDAVSVSILRPVYSLNIQSSGGSVLGSSPGQYHKGDVITLKAIPGYDYTFSSWDTVGIVLNPVPEVSFVMPAHDVIVKPIFLRNSYNQSTLFDPDPSVIIVDDPTFLLSGVTVTKGKESVVVTDDAITFEKDSTIKFKDGTVADIPPKSKIEDNTLVIPQDNTAKLYPAKSESEITLSGGSTLKDGVATTGDDESTVVITKSDVTVIVPSSTVIVVEPLKIQSQEDYYIVSLAGYRQLVSNDFIVLYNPYNDLGYTLDWTKYFQDVTKSDWFYNDIKELYLQRIMVGIETDTFGVNIPTSLGMLAVILANISGYKVDTLNNASSFANVASDDYYAPFVEWSRKSGYIYGIGDNLFAPDAPITRQDLVTVLYRYAVKNDIPLSSRCPKVTFADESEISSYAYDAVYGLQSADVLFDRRVDTFDPNDSVPRVEVVAVVRRFLDLLK
jgi:hypothetical protein